MKPAKGTPITALVRQKAKKLKKTSPEIEFKTEVVQDLRFSPMVKMGKVAKTKKPDWSIEIVWMCPALATDLMRSNKGNRKMKPFRNDLARMMSAGEWQQNGEPFIQDKNGNLKNGQHRAVACIDSGFCWWAVLIRGVDPDVMKTIDTGIKRSLADLLEISGYVNVNNLGAATIGILKYRQGGMGIGSSGANRGRFFVPHTRALQFVSDNYDEMKRIVSKASDIYYAQNKASKILSIRDLAVALYFLGGFDYQAEQLEYLRNICGISILPGTIARLIYKDLLWFRNNNATVTGLYKEQSIIQGWNFFVKGNPEVAHWKVDMDINAVALEYGAVKTINS